MSSSHLRFRIGIESTVMPVYLSGFPAQANLGLRQGFGNSVPFSFREVLLYGDVFGKIS